MRSIIIVFLLFLPFLSIGQQRTFIKISMSGVTEPEALFGRLKGNSIIPLDTIALRNGVAETSIENPLRGVYRLQYNDSLFIEFLVAGDSSIFLQTSARNMFGDMKVIGSPENQLFFHYWQYRLLSDDSLDVIINMGNRMLGESGGQNTPALDSLKQVYLAMVSRQKKHVEDIIRDYDGWLAAALIRAYQIPDYASYAASTDTPLPESEFYRTHFFNNIDFTEPGLVNSDVYYIAINDYMSNFTKPASTEKYVSACDQILLSARQGEVFYEYALNLLIRNFEYTVWESVFANLVERHYLKWEGRDSTIAEYYARKASAIRNLTPGSEAPELNLPDTTGYFLSLHQVPGNTKMLVFWSADCESCEDVMPDLLQISLDFAEQGLSVYAVSMDYDKDIWMEGIRKNMSQSWYHVTDFQGMAGPAALSYNIWMTPVIYLLDADNRIISRPHNLTELRKTLEAVYTLD
jgi:thiol-disulfide isomerase/thioredoxin